MVLNYYNLKQYVLGEKNIQLYLSIIKIMKLFHQHNVTVKLWTVIKTMSYNYCTHANLKPNKHMIRHKFTR